MKKIIPFLIALLVISFPLDSQGQRQRAKTKTKAKTTKVSGNKTGGPKTSAEAKKQKEAAEKEIKQTQQQIKENESKVKKELTELGKLGVEIDETNSTIKNLNVRISQLSENINTLEKNITTNESELTRLRQEYLKAVKKMRITRKYKSDLAFIFSSGNMNQALRRMRYLKEFSKWRKKQTEEINSKIIDLQNEKAALAKAREDQTTALTLQQTGREKLQQQQAKKETLVAELKKNGAALESHLKRKQAEARDLGNKVSQLIAEEQRKAAEEAQRKAAEEAKRLAEEEAKRKAEEQQKQQEELLAQQQTPKQQEAKSEKKESKKSDKTSVSENKKPAEYADARKRAPRSQKSSSSSGSNSTTQPSNTSGSFQDMRGKLPSPSSGSFKITSKFGRQSLPDLPDVEYDNPGIDAESDAGASARAVFKGKVSGVYLLPGYNTVVIVNHGGYYTVYGNISSPTVKTGDSVEAGSNLGTLALNEEDSSHSEIHFEVWKNREKLNPQEWLR